MRRATRNVADVLAHAQAVVAKAQLARDRSEEIRLHALLRRWQGEPATVDPADEAVLREHLFPELQ